MADDGIAKFRAPQQRGIGHEALEIVSHCFRHNGALNALNDEISSLRPTHVAQHHLRRQNDGTGVMQKVHHFRTVGNSTALLNMSIKYLKTWIPAVCLVGVNLCTLYITAIIEISFTQ